MREPPVGAAAKFETAINMDQRDQFFWVAVHFFTCSASISSEIITDKLKRGDNQGKGDGRKGVAGGEAPAAKEASHSTEKPSPPPSKTDSAKMLCFLHAVDSYTVSQGYHA